MTNNSDGLSPTLRPQLGIGWNRALPAPFGFDNSAKFDGVNDIMECPLMLGKDFPVDFCIEIFAKPDFSTSTKPVFFYVQNNRGFISCNPNRNKNLALLAGGGSVPVTGINADTDTVTTAGSFTHYVLNSGFVNPQQGFVNGGLLGGGNEGGANTTLAPISSNKLDNINRFIIGAGDDTYNRIPFFSDFKLADFRIYKKQLPKSQIALNYNAGLGNNPSETEFLWAWWKFKEFEMLDFSALQNGSDMRLGIRDFSGNNFHLLPVNMDTNPASPTYVLKPF